MKLILLIAIGLSTASCSYLQKHLPPKVLKLEKRWVRSTLKNDYYGARVLHRFEPIQYEDLIIQGNAVDGIVAYTQDKGKKIWQLPIKNGVEAGGVINAGKLYFAAGDGFVYCVKAVNGEILWKFPIKSEGIGQPTVADGKVFVVSGSNIAYAINADTGKLIWPYKRPDTSNLSIRGASQPLVEDGVAYIGFNDGYVVALRASTGKEIWQKRLTDNRRFKDVDAHPVIYKGNLYITSFDGALYKLNAKTGETIWKAKEGGFSAATVDDDTVYYASSSGGVLAVENATGKAKWRVPVKDGYATQPKLHMGFLIFGESSGRLKVLDAQSGKLVSSFHPGRGVTSSPLVLKDGKIYFISKEANIFAMRLTRKSKAGELTWQK